MEALLASMMNLPVFALLTVKVSPDGLERVMFGWVWIDTISRGCVLNPRFAADRTNVSDVVSLRGTTISSDFSGIFSLTLSLRSSFLCLRRIAF
jgi:hypothetical protein